MPLHLHTSAQGIELFAHAISAIRRPLALLAFMLALLAADAGKAASDRVAVVLSAQEYSTLKPAVGTLSSGREIADALRGHGFDVAFIVNPSNASARAALRDFADKLPSANLALVVMQGHAIAHRGNSFFLPVNAKITRSMDLLSQGVSIANVAQIVSRAANGVVLALSSVADVPSTLDGIEQRPGLKVAPPKNVVVAFSSSSKVPLSRVDTLTRQATADLVEAVKEKPLKLGALVNAASGGGVGLTFGTVPEVTLSLDAGQDKRSRQGGDAVAPAPQVRKEADNRVKAAEERASRAEERAKQAEAALRLEEQRKAGAAKTATVAAAASAGPAAPGGDAASAHDAAVPDADENDVASLQLVEGLLGRAQRREIQEQLARLAFYEGPLDAVFGSSTRQAIEKFQEQNGAKRTGYLTPRQFQLLVRRAASIPAAEASGREASMIAEAMRGAAHWDHKGQAVFLAARGLDRKFIAERPGGGAILLFDGQRAGNRYHGTAYALTEACGRLPYPAEGAVTAGETTVTLTGEAPLADANCKITGQRREVMEFTFKAPAGRR